MKYYSWHIAGRYQYTKKTETPVRVRVLSILGKIESINAERERQDEDGYFEYKPVLTERLRGMV